jgi:hypothetical protein
MAVSCPVSAHETTLSIHEHVLLLGYESPRSKCRHEENAGLSLVKQKKIKGSIARKSTRTFCIRSRGFCVEATRGDDHFFPFHLFTFNYPLPFFFFYLTLHVV